MEQLIEFSKQANYLLARIRDTVITPHRAQEILTRIGEECARISCRKVLLDERTVERREVPPPDIMRLSAEMEKLGLTEIYMAFWCRPELIDKDADMLSLYTFTNKYTVRHFSEKAAALAWLEQQV